MPSEESVMARAGAAARKDKNTRKRKLRIFYLPALVYYLLKLFYNLPAGALTQKRDIFALLADINQYILIYFIFIIMPR